MGWNHTSSNGTDTYQHRNGRTTGPTIWFRKDSLCSVDLTVTPTEASERAESLSEQASMTRARLHIQGLLEEQEFPDLYRRQLVKYLHKLDH